MLLAAPLPCPGGNLQLALELFEESAWTKARVESLRAAALPDIAEAEQQQALLLASIAALRQNRADANALEQLDGLWRSETTEMPIRTLAAYESGRARWLGAPSPDVLAAFTFAFRHAAEPELFHRAGCFLYRYLQQDAAARKASPVLWQTLQTCRSAWPAAVWRECTPASTGVSPAALPAKWIVRFYRAQISPAIGSRCDLLPSCSEYFLQASLAHGLLGVPIAADRFIREPSVISARGNSVVMPDNRIRYADPLAAHDSWLPANPAH